MLKASTETRALRAAQVLAPEQFLEALNAPVLATTLYLMPTAHGFVAIQDPPVDPGKLCPSFIITALTKQPPICPQLFSDYRNCIERKQAMEMLILPNLHQLSKTQHLGTLVVIANQAIANDIIAIMSWQAETTPIHRSATGIASYLSRNVPITPYDPFQL